MATKLRTLWIDAICINQCDEKERGEQVKCMASIYSWAYRVVVWLGKSSDASQRAMSSFGYLGKQNVLTTAGIRLRFPKCRDPNWYRAACKLPYTDEVWQAILSLLSRPWFLRLWIFQEIQLANPVGRRFIVRRIM
jgi:hypothetical protein